MKCISVYRHTGFSCYLNWENGSRMEKVERQHLLAHHIQWHSHSHFSDLGSAGLLLEAVLLGSACKGRKSSKKLETSLWAQPLPFTNSPLLQLLKRKQKATDYISSEGLLQLWCWSSSCFRPRLTNIKKIYPNWFPHILPCQVRNWSALNLR